MMITRRTKHKKILPSTAKPKKKRREPRDKMQKGFITDGTQIWSLLRNVVPDGWKPRVVQPSGHAHSI